MADCMSLKISETHILYCENTEAAMKYHQTLDPDHLCSSTPPFFKDGKLLPKNPDDDKWREVRTSVLIPLYSSQG